MSLVAALLLAAGTATPQRWWFLFGDAEQVWFADVPSMLVDDGTSEISYQTVYRLSQEGTAYEITRTRFYCDQRIALTISSYSFKVDGAPVTGKGATFKNPTPYTIVPESNAETLLTFACASPLSWQSAGFKPIYREPQRVARDFYVLIQKYELDDEDAAALATLDGKTQKSQIEELISSRVRRELRNKLREAYGLRPDNIS